VKWFKLPEIKVSQPFVAKGFPEKVTGIVAGEGLNILIISTFSKDYALVREGNPSAGRRGAGKRASRLFGKAPEHKPFPLPQRGNDNKDEIVSLRSH
jgi:hypothetical protein